MTDKIIEVAEKANMIVNGYAFSKTGNQISVLNLNRPEKAAVLSDDGTVLETSMDDIELQIVENCLAKNRQFMED
jgi:hypothetical protein